MASPVRSASATWQVITNLVADTIAVSASCTRDEAEQAMRTAAPVGRMLIAGGHLDLLPLVLVAGAVHCEITTISGTAALREDENVNVIPGAATATAFTIYLPTPEPLRSLIADAVARHERLSDAEPPTPAPTAASGRTSVVNADALRKAVAGR